jgi:hypothetical protein
MPLFLKGKVIITNKNTNRFVVKCKIVGVLQREHVSLLLVRNMLG